jgi:nondiscriminating glutamyl-tRNA synthetase
MEKVRVRFAPSPTGQLHLGSLRTALYDYLFAKKHKGSFILRIEDTDQKRFVPGSVENLFRTLDDMGVHHDEGIVLSGKKLTSKGSYGPYVQSERLAIYQEHAEKLIASGHAYYCFCSVTRLAALREEQSANKQAPKYDKFCLSLSAEDVEERLASHEPHVIRLNVSENRGDIVFDDLVRGKVVFHARDVDDPILMKSDGYPTYHLAVVVDDHLMEITHILRSEEWLPSTPKHILLFEAFKWKVPHIGHLSVILGSDGKKKLSKRDGGVTVEHFLSQGYLKEALINFIALLGWNPGAGNTQEIFSLQELEETFDLSGLHKAGAVLDIKKLDWMNGEYIKRLTADALYAQALPFLKTKGFYKVWKTQHAKQSDKDRAEFVKKVLSIEQDRLTKLVDVGENNTFMFAPEISYETKLLHWKQNTPEQTREALESAFQTLSALTSADWEERKTVEKVLMDKAGEKRGDFLWPLRVALTGVDRSPSPFDVAWVLGKVESLRRITLALKKLS